MHGRESIEKLLPIRKRIGPLNQAPDREMARRDSRSVLSGLAARFASCACRADIQSALAESCRSLFGCLTAPLYVPGPLGTYSPVARDLQQRDFPASPALLSYFLRGNRVWHPGDREYKPDEEERDFVSAFGIVLVVPLIFRGKVAGLAFLGPGLKTRVFTPAQTDLVSIIAALAASALANLKLSDELSEMRQLEGMARISSFMVHDLKNLAQSLSLLVDNAEENITNVLYQRDFITSLRQTARSMKELSHRVRDVTGASSRKQLMDLRFLCKTVIGEFRKSRPRAGIVLRGEAVFCLLEGEEFRKVLVNILQNALDAVGDKGLILVETGMRKGQAWVSIADSGCGMDPDFIRDELFRPFRTTKKTGMGIGLYQCRQIVESLGGVITAASESGRGSTFSIYLPASDPHPVSAA